MWRGVLQVISVYLLVSLSPEPTMSQDPNRQQNNVLYINSYALGYSWTDSLVKGVTGAFASREDVQLYIEFLDAKRFGQEQFERFYHLYHEKYQDIRFDLVITSDNDALDFLLQYGDSLLPDIPRIFCGINNPEAYDFSGADFYGILEAVDLRTEINLIIKLMPEIKKLYFITDNSTTSLLNLNYVKKIEPEYASRVKFEYIHNLPPDSLLKAVAQFEKGNAIALLNYYSDNQGRPLDPEVFYKEIVRHSAVPVITDSEFLLGNGLAGGIINNGANHGHEVANLALKFIDDPAYEPSMRIAQQKGTFYFDYNVLQQFGIGDSNLPVGSVVINKPERRLIQYLKNVMALLGIIGLLLLVIFILYFNVQRRKQAEVLVTQKLEEIQEKNNRLLQAHQKVNEMNAELEKLNNHLSKTNEALSEARQQAVESDKLKSAFLANMSHEIRTPLNAIIGFASLMHDPVLNKEEREEYFDIITANSNQLLRVIDDILDLSKIEAGQLKVFVEAFSVKDMLVQLVDSYTESNANRLVDIRLASFVSNNNLTIKSDPVRFRQIFNNLLSNAIKFTREGFIEVGYHFDSPGEITFYVKDTGTGIAWQEQKNIFTRFWKGELHGEKFFSGVGLGLAICKKLSETLGGRIWLDSEPGVGTTFYIAFQDYLVKKKDLSRTSSPEALDITGALTGRTIAIAEDEVSNLVLLKRMLKPLKASLICFSTGAEIVDYFRSNPDHQVDLILMDIKMPDMDGIEAARHIHEIDPAIPVIAQTAYAMAEDIEKIKSSAFSDYIAKPIKTAVLIEKVQRLINHQKTA